jgi:catechol 2,3-dioxygenase-like lactoylglutathione lyase family enzyme
MQIERLDHLVLTCADIVATSAFYERVLGMKPSVTANGRHSVSFGNQKINLHPTVTEIKPRAARPTPGSADLCFITESAAAEVAAHLERQGVSIEIGPVERPGALGAMDSVYFRDPDGNLVEVSKYKVRSS